ncbi:thiol:disulfide interchange protein [Thermanaerovibrio velox DSM 12556]|uniref:Thiol:disulfide interchange protein n=1 Tax=Thermanaerovibrio velox DSM 12556 TaxID=926567 RepID=H0UQP0_9BACT|nr:cytochrome c biogenesis protein CcdA [Thermanaerovibrio velox]EHM10804.1 thiol:disulfide interchange protein [Thermanaerovibrio velox DSM 12556]
MILDLLDLSALSRVGFAHKLLYAGAIGLVGALSPCFLVTAPLTMAVVGGDRDVSTRKGLLLGGCLALGIGLVYVPLGAGASALGALLGRGGGFFYGLIGGMLLLSGLAVLGLVELPTPRLRTIGFPPGPLGAVLTGSALAVVSSPCSSPFLIAMLSAAVGSGSAVSGALLMLVYSMGHSVPFILAGLSGAAIRRVIESRWLSAGERAFRLLAGLIMLAAAARFLYLAF